MARLNHNNCRVDLKSGGIIFDGSPELQEIINLRADIRNINTKLDKLIELINGGVLNGRKVENSGFSTDNDQKVQ